MQSGLNSTVYPAITLIYLIVNIIFGNYIILNLFLGILLGGFEDLDKNDLG